LFQHTAKYLTRLSLNGEAIIFIQLHTKNPKKAIDAIAYTIEISPNTGFLLYVETICDTIPNPGTIKIYHFSLL
jgi:hypothetical protein